MSGRPRVAFMTPRVPWPIDRGDRLRAFHLVQCLAPFADITLVTTTHGDPATTPVGELSALCSRIELIHLPKRGAQLNMVLALAGRTPFQVAFFRSRAMERVVERLARERFDFVMGHMFRVFPYVERFTGTPKYMDLTDSLALNLQRAAPIKLGLAGPAFREEWRRVEAYEAHVMDRVEETWVVTEVDREDLLRRRPRAAVRVVPNGVTERWGNAGLETDKRPVVLFLGNLTVGHNVDAAVQFREQVWPRVRRELPQAELLLVGDPAPRVRALGGRDGVQVLGYQEDLGPVLARALVSVAPLRYGAGIQNKVLETMAAGLPAHMSSIVARPLGATAGREVVVADSVEESAATLLALLRDPPRARAIGLAGQAFVRARFSWDRASERFREIAARHMPRG